MQNKYNQNDVSILLPDIGSVQTVSQRRFLRRWNQLSRLQRTFVYVVALAAILLLCFMLLEKNKKEEVTFKESLIANITVKPVTLQIENDIQSNEVFPKTENRIPHKFTGPTNKRQEAVVRSFQHAWSGYKTHAWGHDNLKPITGTASNWFTLGLTIVDSLDTAYIMGLKKEFGEGKQWIADELSFDLNKDVNFFEVTIRVLGALLANYQLTFEEMFLQKAIQLGDKLLGAFNSGSGIPYSDVNLATKHAHSPDWSPYSSTAEVTTVQLEFRQLSRASGDSIYEDSAARVSEMIHQLPKKSGLVPIYINPTTGKFLPYATVTLGARGDSYYEYLLKQWIQTGKTIDYLLEDYVTAIEGVREHLAKRSSPNRLLFIGELTSGSENFSPKMDHLTCFLPGTLALGVLHGLPHWHMKLAEELMWTCYQTYAAHPTFLAPEITHFNMGSSSSSDMYTKAADSHSLLRPEFVESLWYMYQITGNTTFQDWGWQIYEAFEKYAKVERGYTSLNNVRTVNTVPRDMMESFFLSETLKYLYLLFSDDRYLLDLKRYVINTEAHPLPIHSS